ncbi:hypothetical protein BSKO_02673 [Bryopsis sp. KO-2023]|nr:hypothetical protein BSKO_02673 [Bryopsis sp. KO-2023]
MAGLLPLHVRLVDLSYFGTLGKFIDGWSELGRLGDAKGNAKGNGLAYPSSCGSAKDDPLGGAASGGVSRISSDNLSRENWIHEPVPYFGRKLCIDLTSLPEGRYGFKYASCLIDLASRFFSKNEVKEISQRENEAAKAYAERFVYLHGQAEPGSKARFLWYWVRGLKGNYAKQALM